MKSAASNAGDQRPEAVQSPLSEVQRPAAGLSPSGDDPLKTKMKSVDGADLQAQSAVSEKASEEQEQAKEQEALETQQMEAEPREEAVTTPNDYADKKETEKEEASEGTGSDADEITKIMI